jgi:hypothetical protein
LGAVIAASSHAGEAVNAPSKLDYMVLASYVNSPHILSMASYRSTARQATLMPDGKFTPNRKAGAGQPAAGVPGAGQPGAGQPAPAVVHP